MCQQNCFPSTPSGRAEIGWRVQAKPDRGDLGPLLKAPRRCPRAQAASNVGEGVGVGLQRLVKPCGDLGGRRKEGEGLASCTLQDRAAKGRGRWGGGGAEVSRHPGPLPPLASLSPFLSSQPPAERPREDARERQAERERKGRDGEPDGVRRTTPFSLVTLGNSLRWRQALLTMCVKNARLEKLVASKVPPLSRGG